MDDFENCFEQYQKELEPLIFGPFNPNALRQLIQKYKDLFADGFAEEAKIRSDDFLKVVYDSAREQKKQALIEQGKMSEIEKLVKQYGGPAFDLPSSN